MGAVVQGSCGSSGKEIVCGSIRKEILCGGSGKEILCLGALVKVSSVEAVVNKSTKTQGRKRSFRILRIKADLDLGSS